MNNQTLLTAFSSALVLFQYPLALFVCLIMVIMRFTYCMKPNDSAYDFTWRSYAINAVFCIIWLIFTIGGFFLLIFGTVLDQVKYEREAM